MSGEAKGDKEGERVRERERERERERDLELLGLTALAPVSLILLMVLGQHSAATISSTSFLSLAATLVGMLQ